MGFYRNKLSRKFRNIDTETISIAIGTDAHNCMH